jgi:malate dehydrogenase (oxaloacetate-decarboxylating)
MNVPTLRMKLRGMDLLDTPIFNKGTAFTDEERSAFGLHGLLPPQIESLDEQTSRAYEADPKMRFECKRDSLVSRVTRCCDMCHSRLTPDALDFEKDLGSCLTTM